MPIPRRYFKILQALTASAKSGQPTVRWDEFHGTFKNYFDFEVRRGANGKHTFTPPVDGANGRWGFGSTKFRAYEPNDKEFSPREMMDLRKTLKAAYGWGPDTFSRR
ncbi:uncharacterized protein TRAVEDRAFT_17554 [Trametes versicolor FP-101664 SS1]|uniref:uncharacterized protein n=1 Tax=Trametes versicolor (strain FP-101664) TaxID=717944 RepID=UPI0004621266|nr:uncharacterized protein TRAVEDRAFT_17554 [Trametes versicolor FP-101664 SS1]EIW63090.1 hypothetical protein TRAVEDRAFT_17554 [Trametes versicolor FP-101664 SS1]